MPRDPDVLGQPSRRSEEHTSELQSRSDLVCRLLLEKKKILIDRFLEDAIEVDVDALSDGTDVYIGGIMDHFFVFFFNDTATTEIYTLSLHDALPIAES